MSPSIVRAHERGHRPRFYLVGLVVRSSGSTFPSGRVLIGCVQVSFALHERIEECFLGVHLQPRLLRPRPATCCIPASKVLHLARV
jgi:hypothetical protein